MLLERSKGVTERTSRIVTIMRKGGTNATRRRKGKLPCFHKRPDGLQNGQSGQVRRVTDKSERKKGEPDLDFLNGQDGPLDERFLLLPPRLRRLRLFHGFLLQKRDNILILGTQKYCHRITQRLRASPQAGEGYFQQQLLTSASNSLCLSLSW